MKRLVLIVIVPFFLAFDEPIVNGLKPEVVSIKSTDTAMIFTVTTQTYGGQYSPKHCLAIWITDQNNVFKRTLKLAASSYKLHLVKWNQMSGGNVTDAITGASLNNHTTHTVVWNGKDKNGALQPDGQYKVYIEFTEENSLQSSIPDGPWTSFTFNKGTLQTQNPSDFSYTYNGQNKIVFKNIAIQTYGATIINEIESVDKIEISPNPIFDEAQFRVKLNKAASLNLTILNINGILVKQYPCKVYSEGDHIFFWYPKASKLNTGIYFAKLKVNSKVLTYKLIVL